MLETQNKERVSAADYSRKAGELLETAKAACLSEEEFSVSLDVLEEDGEDALEAFLMGMEHYEGYVLGSLAAQKHPTVSAELLRQVLNHLHPTGRTLVEFIPSEETPEHSYFAIQVFSPLDQNIGHFEICSNHLTVAGVTDYLAGLMSDSRELALRLSPPEPKGPRVGPFR
jgi:hypothetical protein